MPDRDPLGREAYNASISRGMQDISRAGLPLALIASLIIVALGVGLWVGQRNSGAEGAAASIAELKLQVQNLSSQVTQISISLAKGPTLPENVAYKADLLRFCTLNKTLTCPNF